MNIVSLENVSKSYGFRPLFENVTLGLELSFKETREFKAVEQRIAETEKRLPEIEKELTAASDAGRVHELFIEQKTLNTRLETDLSRWTELAERLEG